MFTENQPFIWKMYFDGASSMDPATSSSLPRIKVGAGIVFVTPAGGIIQHSVSFSEPRTNNEAEYEALILGLEIAIQMGIEDLHILGYSQLVINQVEGEYKVYKHELTRYCAKVQQLLTRIPNYRFERISRACNNKADALARLAKELADPNRDETHITIKNRRIISPASLDVDENSLLEEVLQVEEQH